MMHLFVNTDAVVSNITLGSYLRGDTPLVKRACRQTSLTRLHATYLAKSLQRFLHMRVLSKLLLMMQLFDGFLRRLQEIAVAVIFVTTSANWITIARLTQHLCVCTSIDR